MKNFVGGNRECQEQIHRCATVIEGRSGGREPSDDVLYGPISQFEGGARESAVADDAAEFGA